MLHHVSFNARDPKNVARVLAEMLAGTIVRAPSPPFPIGSWFVCYGDSSGSFLEILPWSTVLDPDMKFGFSVDESNGPGRASGHANARPPAQALAGDPRTSIR